MARPVIERIYPSEPHSTDAQINTWAASFARELTAALQEHGFRLNLAITDDGETAMKAPLILATFTVATLPNPVNFKAGIILVSDGLPGQQFRASNGVAWVNLG